MNVITVWIPLVLNNFIKNRLTEKFSDLRYLRRPNSQKRHIAAGWCLQREVSGPCAKVFSDK